LPRPALAATRPSRPSAATARPMPPCDGDNAPIRPYYPLHWQSRPHPTARIRPIAHRRHRQITAAPKYRDCPIFGDRPNFPGAMRTAWSVKMGLSPFDPHETQTYHSYLYLIAKPPDWNLPYPADKYPAIAQATISHFLARLFACLLMVAFLTVVTPADRFLAAEFHLIATIIGRKNR